MCACSANASCLPKEHNRINRPRILTQLVYREDTVSDHSPASQQGGHSKLQPWPLIQSKATANQHNASIGTTESGQWQVKELRDQDGQYEALIQSSRVLDEFGSFKMEAAPSKLQYSQTGRGRHQQSHLEIDMTHAACRANSGQACKDRKPICASEDRAMQHTRCLHDGSLGCSHTCGERRWRIVGTRRRQRVNSRKQVERVIIDVASGQTYGRKIRRRIADHNIKTHCQAFPALHPDKRHRNLCESRSRRSVSQNTCFDEREQQDVARTRKRCASAHRELSARERPHERQLMQPLIQRQSATSLSSTSTASMQSVPDASWRTQSSRASISSLSLIQFSRRSELSARRQHTSNRSLEALNMECTSTKRAPDGRGPEQSDRKRSIAAHFYEAAFSKKPTWRTDLTNSDLSAYASSSDEYGDDEVFETAASTGKLGASRRFSSCGLRDDDLKLFEDLSGFGSRVAKFSSTDEEHVEVLNPRRPTKRPTYSRARKAPRLKALQRPEVVSTHSLGFEAKGSKFSRAQKSEMLAATPKLDVEGRGNDRAQMADKSCGGRTRKLMLTQFRRPHFRYWPLVSLSSAFSTSTTNRAASTYSSEAYDRDSQTGRNKSASDVDKSHPLTGRNREAVKARTQLKQIMQKNLVASLIGLYIVISLAVIVVLMVPYISGPLERPVGVSVAMQTSDEGEISTQRQQESMIRKMTSMESFPERDNTTRAPAPPSNQLAFQLGAANQLAPAMNSSLPVDDAGSRKRQLDSMRKRLLLARVVQMRTETRARESESFQELWRVVHRRSCSPLKIPFCSRSLASMMPESATISADFLASLPGGNFMSYDKTLLPNQFTMGRQTEVESVLERYDPLVDVRCYALMPLFLCSIFAPKCVQINATMWTQNQLYGGDSLVPGRSISSSKPALRKATGAGQTTQNDAPDLKESVDFLDQLFPAHKSHSSAPLKVANKTGAKVQLARLVPPCRSVCREALRKCSFFLEVLSLTLFTAEDCEHLPESSDEKVCVGQRENALLQRAEANVKCRANEFRCSNGDCIPQKWHCDGFTDCSDKSDEQRCAKCDSTSEFYCGHEVCIDKMQVCDGHIDCQDGRDERLCLRLANNSAPTNARKAHLRRLEAWNATLAQWTPVCGNQWQPMPMSHEVCQALGYSRANETLILFDSSPSSPSRGRLGVRSPPMLDHSVSYRHSRPLKSADPDKQTRQLVADRGASATSLIDVELSSYHPNPILLTGSSPKSLIGLLQMGTRCVPTGNEQLLSTIHLSCQGFQCGRSVTSYLLRVDPQQRLSLIQAQPNMAIGVGPASSESPSLSVKSPSIRSLMNSFDWNSTAGDSHWENSDLSSDESGDSESEPSDSEESKPTVSQLEEAGGESPAPVSARLVVGGIESMPGEFPYLAALHGGPDEVFFCGGVLISTNWLLTAAHCVGNRTQPEGWMVKVGVTRRIASPAFVRKLKVRRIIKHHSFNVGAHLNNDIALIQLAEDVEFNQYLRPICLPPIGLKLGPDSSKDCVVVGFGKSRFSQDANYLHAAHFAKVPIISQQQCALWYAEQDVKLAEGMMCAGYSEGKHDACQGDSGSGLFCRHSNTNQFFVAGVVSFGIKCATPRLPGVYTSVPHYVDWINRVTGNNSHLAD